MRRLDSFEYLPPGVLPDENENRHKRGSKDTKRKGNGKGSNQTAGKNPKFCASCEQFGQIEDTLKVFVTIVEKKGTVKVMQFVSTLIGILGIT